MLMPDQSCDQNSWCRKLGDLPARTHPDQLQSLHPSPILWAEPRLKGVALFRLPAGRKYKLPLYWVLGCDRLGFPGLS